MLKKTLFCFHIPNLIPIFVSIMKVKFLLFFFLLPLLYFAQSKIRYKYELLGGIGTTNFLGDLGGANQVGTRFLRDYDFKATRPIISVGGRYRSDLRYAFKAMLEMGIVAGKDSYTKDIYRQNRNLSFSSPIIELSAQAEYYFIGVNRTNLYNISGVKGKKKRKYTMYAATGIGVFFYSPSAKYDGKRYRLRKLHTEGQGLEGGPKQYSNFNICIPIALGYNYIIDTRWSIGAELGFRKTFTDYIDDVSGTYYDKALLKQNYGDITVALADQSLGLLPTATMPNGDGSGAQRGETKYKDSYMFLEFNASYKFSKKRRTRSKF